MPDDRAGAGKREAAVDREAGAPEQSEPLREAAIQVTRRHSGDD
jgi:hypothetical protein